MNVSLQKRAASIILVVVKMSQKIECIIAQIRPDFKFFLIDSHSYPCYTFTYLNDYNIVPVEHLQRIKLKENGSRCYWGYADGTANEPDRHPASDS